jgi:hypothetical protein
MKPGEYGWATVCADSAGRAYVPFGASVREHQDAIHSPHFLIKQEDSSLLAKLYCQRVVKYDWDGSTSKAVYPVEKVEV